MPSDKTNRFWLTSGLLLAIIFTVAFRTGELVELETFLARQEKSDLIKPSQSVQFIVPKETRAKVISATRLDSGNFALELEIEGLAPGGADSAHTIGRQVWVLYRKDASSVILRGTPNENRKLAQDTSSSEARDPGLAELPRFASFTRDTPAIARWVNPINESVEESLRVSGPPVEVDHEIIKAREKNETAREAEQSRWEKSMPLSSLKGRGLSSELQ